MTLSEPTIRRWSKKEYHEAADLGWFEGQRVELIDGEVVEMAAQKDGHAMSVTLTGEAAREAFGRGYTFRVQMPLNVGASSEPEPDLVVVRGLPRTIRKHPTSAALVVEVADTTLLYDRRKGSLYASRGIKDYWIVNLVDRVVEVRRKPVASAGAPWGHAYAEIKVYGIGDTIAPLAARKARVRVEDLLP